MTFTEMTFTEMTFTGITFTAMTFTGMTFTGMTLTGMTFKVMHSLIASSPRRRGSRKYQARIKCRKICSKSGCLVEISLMQIFSPAMIRKISATSIFVGS